MGCPEYSSPGMDNGTAYQQPTFGAGTTWHHGQQSRGAWNVWGSDSAEEGRAYSLRFLLCTLPLAHRISHTRNPGEVALVQV